MTKTRKEILDQMEGEPMYKEGVEDGRESVLVDFDNMCAADAFVGFTNEEWTAIKKFFAFNRSLQK